MLISFLNSCTLAYSRVYSASRNLIVYINKDFNFIRREKLLGFTLKHLGHSF